jgi:hypothetical protein
MLLGNYTVLNKSTGRNFGGGTVSETRANWGGNSRRNQYLDGFQAQTAVPNGYLPPYCFVLPQKSGGMAMRAVASGTLSANLVPTRYMTIDFTGTGDFDATAALVISMVAAFSGSGSMTAAIVGRLNATCDMTGSGDLEADMSGIASAVIAMLGSGDLEATIAAFGDMSIDMVVTGTGLTTANVGPAVWASIAAANNAPGSMGEKLNDAGSAANPWTEVIESGYTAAEILRLLAAVAAGKASGGGTDEIVIRGLGDDKNRVTLTVDENGNRTAASLDLSP